MFVDGAFSDRVFNKLPTNENAVGFKSGVLIGLALKSLPKSNIFFSLSGIDFKVDETINRL